MSSNKITWTKTDEAPALASHALLPIIRAYLKARGGGRNGRHLARRTYRRNFSDRLRDDQRIPDELTRLGVLAQTPDANIIKLPTSAPRFRSYGRRSRNSGKRATTYPTIPRRRRRRRSARCRPGLPWSWARR